MKKNKKKNKKSVKAHKVLEQIDQRPIKTRLCAQKGCKFYGKEAQQGVCYSAEGELVDWDRFDAHEREINNELRAMKKREGKDYVRALEAHYVSAMMNWEVTLDECIRLRRDIALLKVRS